jgi:hypothetical protein
VAGLETEIPKQLPVAVQLAVARDCDADRGRDQPVRLARRRFRHDDERDLPVLETLDAFAARQDAALRRKDARYPHQVAGRDPGRAQRQLERGQLLAVLAHTFGEEHLLGHESGHVSAPWSKGKSRESAW